MNELNRKFFGVFTNAFITAKTHRKKFISSLNW